MKRIGFVGVGAMGRGMVKNLLRAGFQVIAHDVSAEAMNAVSGLGAIATTDLVEVARGTDVVCLSLPGPREVVSVVEGILPYASPGTCIVDMSTIDPGTTRRLARMCSDRGLQFLDAPVSGGPGGADQGTLTIMVGGDEGAYHNIQPLLRAMGKNIFYMGSSGMGQVVKLAHNLLVAAITVALGEAFQVAEKAGLSPQLAAQVFGKGVGRSGTLEVFGPNIINKKYPALFALKHMHKDLSLYMRMAEEAGVPCLIGSLVHQLYRSAMAKGWGELDHSAVCRVVEGLGVASQ